MHTNNTNKKIIYPELSYTITGLCFDIHNIIGRFCREKQYCDFMESKLKEIKMPYQREHIVGKTGNRVDFLIDDKIVLEVKAKPLLVKEDYYQTQRYLQILDKKLGLILNFRNRYIKPVRIVKIETDAKSKFV